MSPNTFAAVQTAEHLSRLWSSVYQHYALSRMRHPPDPAAAAAGGFAFTAPIQLPMELIEDPSKPDFIASSFLRDLRSLQWVRCYAC